jgi:hypothetical protein
MKREKLIIKLLVSSMCISLLPTTISFAETTGAGSSQSISSTATSESDFTFDASTGTIEKYIGTNPIVVIPSTINGVSVKSIGDDAFTDNTNITSVEIPHGVESIGVYSFYRCSELTKLIIPDSVTVIKSTKSLCACDKAFFYVESENTIQLLLDNTFINANRIILNGQELNNISKYLFDENTGTIKYYVGSDTALIIPSTINGVPVLHIGDGAFQSNSNITSVVIPNGVTSIGRRAFFACDNLRNITIPNSVTSVVGGVASGSFADTNCTLNVDSEVTKQLLISNDVGESCIVLGSQSSQTPETKVASISINSINTNLTVGQTEILVPTVLPDNTTNKGLRWTSNNTNVATVDVNGKVTAVGVGSAIIICTAIDGSGVVRSIGMTVSEQTNSNSTLKSVSITGTEKVGHKLKAKIKYEGAEPSLSYQWQRTSSRDGNYENIEGETDNEYKLKNSDKNKYIRLVVNERISGRIFTLEDITSRIRRDTLDSSKEDDKNSSNSSNTNSSDNYSKNVVLKSNTYIPSDFNSQSPANRRFRNPSGGRVTGWVETADGTRYYLNQNGDITTGWVNLNNRWYYFNTDDDIKRGAMRTGWIKDNGNWYYLHNNGQMAVSTTIDGYTLGYDGRMI